MKALISPIEQRGIGYRVAEVHPDGFEVAPPLFWVNCSDDVVADLFWFDPTDNKIKETPEIIVDEPISIDQPTVIGAQDL